MSKMIRIFFQCGTTFIHLTKLNGGNKIVLRIEMDHNFHNTDILNKKLDYYGLPTRPVRFSTWIRSVLSSCKDNIFDHDCNMHVIDNECDIDPEYHCVRIRVTKKLEDHSCSRTILDRVKKKLEENKDRLICQVSAFVWSLEDQWEIARERLDDNFNPYEERLDDRFDPSTVFSIDWESFETRLETHPSEALFSHVVSRQFFRNRDFQGQFRHDRYHHVSILHAICFETSFRYPFTIPVSALKKLVEAHPNALTLRSEGPSKGNLPLHYVLEQISLGRSDWLVDHIKVLLEAFPEGASVESVVDVQRGGFSNLETYEYRQYPIEILCSYGEWAKFARRRRRGKAMGGWGINCSNYENLNEHRLGTIEHGVQVLLDVMDSSILTTIRNSDKYLFKHPLHALCWAYDKENEHDESLNQSIVRTYIALLRVTARKLPYDDDGLLHISLRPEHGGVYDVNESLPEVLKVIRPPALRTVNEKGLIPLHVAIENTKLLRGRFQSVDSSLRMCVDVLIEADPSCLAVRERRNSLFPFMLAAVADKANVDVIYHVLRKDPSVFSDKHICSAGSNRKRKATN